MGQVITAATLLASATLVFAESGIAATIPLSLENNTWKQVVVPATRDIPTLAQLFGSSFSDHDYQADWVAFGYDSESGYFVPELEDPLLVGSSLWLIHDTGSDMVIDIDVDGSFRNASARQSCPGETACAISEFESSSEDVVWLFTGSPFPNATLVSDWLVNTIGSTTVCAGGCTLQQAGENGISDNGLYVYNGLDGYDKLTGEDRIEPLQGYWFGTIPPENNITTYLSVPLIVSTVVAGNDLLDLNGASSYIGQLDLNGEGLVSLSGVRNADGLPSALTSAMVYSIGDEAEDIIELQLAADSPSNIEISHPNLGVFTASETLEGDRNISYKDPETGEVVRGVLTGVDSEYFGFNENLKLQPKTTLRSLFNETSSISQVEVYCPDESGGELVDADLLITQINPIIDGNKPELKRNVPFTRVSKGVYEFEMSSEYVPTELQSTISKADKIIAASCLANDLLLRDKKKLAASLAKTAKNRPLTVVRIMGLLSSVSGMCKTQERLEYAEALERSLYSPITTLSAHAYRSGMGSSGETKWQLQPGNTSSGTRKVILGEGSCPPEDPVIEITGVSCTHEVGSFEPITHWNLSGVARNNPMKFDGGPVFIGGGPWSSTFSSNETTVISSCNQWSNIYSYFNYRHCEQATSDLHSTQWSISGNSPRDNDRVYANLFLALPSKPHSPPVLASQRIDGLTCPGTYNCSGGLCF